MYVVIDDSSQFLFLSRPLDFDQVTNFPAFGRNLWD
jgi:hypothetical protein